LFPTGDKSRHRRYSSRKAIAFWILISVSFWLVLGLVLSAVWGDGTDRLEAEGKGLSKIAPAAGGAAPTP
jgi:hypothetical protein